MIEVVSVDRAVRRGHEPVSDAEASQVDLDLSRWVLVVDLLGDGGHELAGVGLAEREELVALVLGEELEELDEALVQVSTDILLEKDAVTVQEFDPLSYVTGNYWLRCRK